MSEATLAPSVKEDVTASSAPSDWMFGADSSSGEVTEVTCSKQEIVTHRRWDLMRCHDGSPDPTLVPDSNTTEPGQLNEKFLRAQRLESLGALAGGIAHDLNNALTPIMMCCQLLGMNVSEPDRQSIVSTIEISAERCADMVRQVLWFARGAQSGREPLHLRDVVGELERMLRHTFPKSIEIHVSIPRELPLVSGDPTQMSQVLMNVCVNARDAMPQGGRLEIEARRVDLDENHTRMNPEARPGRYVHLSVSDTGHGIAADVLDRIFDPFYTSKKPDQGTGLGLWIVCGILKSHGGFCRVHSEMGRGTRLSIYLPAVSATRGDFTPPPARPVSDGHGELVLFVDDEAAIREISKATLEAHGYRVITANEGTEAVAAIAKHGNRIKLAVIDMVMPFLDGPNTLRALRKLDPNLRVIVIGGNASGDRTAELLRAGACAVLQKPYTADKLLATVERALANTHEPPDRPPQASAREASTTPQKHV